MQIAVLLMFAGVFFWPSPIDWQMNQQNVVIRGAVVDETSGRGLPGATVYATSGALDATTVTDSKGNFIFLTLFPGTYWLCASKDGYSDRGCRPRDAQPPELFAGFEYGATIVLPRVQTTVLFGAPKPR
ncbi:MAG TPA: carboxypeptidase-like regulatory domain-containing protein [Candidatus Binatia bacterium]|nr:carboxypeptidase-like regulatory domain-containing protein [Candidatus Binatia bacterium]